MGLTVAQAEIVNAPLGPILVTAGAGSGKTRVLTTRLIHLLQIGIPEQTIVALEIEKNDPFEAKLSTLIKLAKALHCKVRDLYPCEKCI